MGRRLLSPLPDPQELSGTQNLRDPTLRLTLPAPPVVKRENIMRGGQIPRGPKARSWRTLVCPEFGGPSIQPEDPGFLGPSRYTSFASKLNFQFRVPAIRNLWVSAGGWGSG